jgi:hypothetical protein
MGRGDRNVLSLSIAVLLAALGAAANARAEPEEAIVVEAEGPALCADAEEFFKRVQTRAIGVRRASAGESARKFVFGVGRVEPGFRGHLVVQHLDGRSARREVTGESCDEVIDALALITALDIDPRAAEVRTPVARAAEPPALSIEPKLEPEPDPGQRVPPSPAQWEARAGAGFAVSGGVVPVVLASLPVQIEVRRVPVDPGASPFASPSFAIGFERTLNGTAEGSSPDRGSGDVTFHLTRAFVAACPLALLTATFRASPCVTVEGGAISGEGVLGKSLVSRTTDSRAWLAAGLSGRAHQRLWGPVSLEAEAGVGVPLVSRYEFRLDPNVSVGKVKSWNFRVGAGLLVHFL